MGTFLKNSILIGLIMLMGIGCVATMPATVHADEQGDIAYDTSSVPPEQISQAQGWGLTLAAKALGVISAIILWFFQIITALAGKAFDFSIQLFVVGMADLINSNAGINIAWSVMRDIANAVFLFILIYIGIMTILRASAAKWKSLVAMLIVAAILVNFSMVLTKVVIDISNVMAYQIYQAFGLDAACYNEIHDDDAECINRGVSTVFNAFLQLPSVMGTQQLAPLNIVFASLGGVLVHTVAIFVFSAGAIFLMSRFVVLAIVIIFSPLAFASLVIPGMRRQWSDWVDHLLKQSFFAPAFLLMLWLTVKIMEAFIAASGGGSQASSALYPDEGATFYNAMITPGSLSMSIFMYYGLAATFLIASLITARRFSIRGSKTIIDWGNSRRRDAWKYSKAWTRRRAAPLAREIESGNAQKRGGISGRGTLGTGYTVRGGIMNIARKGGKIASYVPGVQRSLQNVARTYDADLAKERAKYAKYSTAENIRTISAINTPIQRLALLQTVAQRGDIGTLEKERGGTDFIKKTLVTMENTGVGQLKDDGAGRNAIVRQAPHLIGLAAKDVKEQMALLEKVLPRQTAEEVKKMNVEQFASLEKENKESHDVILDTMIKKYSGTQLTALFQEGNAITEKFAETLLKKAKQFNDSLPADQKLQGNINIVGNYLKKGDKDSSGNQKPINSNAANWVTGKNTGRKVLNAYWGNPEADAEAEDEEEEDK